MTEKIPKIIYSRLVDVLNILRNAEETSEDLREAFCKLNDAINRLEYYDWEQEHKEKLSEINKMVDKIESEMVDKIDSDDNMDDSSSKEAQQSSTDWEKYYNIHDIKLKINIDTTEAIQQLQRIQKALITDEQLEQIKQELREYWEENIYQKNPPTNHNLLPKEEKEQLEKIKNGEIKYLEGGEVK